MNARWPRLGPVIEKLQRPGIQRGVHYALDWVPYSYSREQLLLIAKDLKRAPSIPTSNGGVWNNALDILLLELADNKAALKALNHRQPTLPVTGLITLNRAVHAYVVRQLNTQKTAAGAYLDVGTEWGVKEDQVEADVGMHMLRIEDLPANATPMVRDGIWHAAYIAEEILKAACLSTPAYKDVIPAYKGITRRQALVALDADLKTRAASAKSVKRKSRKK